MQSKFLFLIFLIFSANTFAQNTSAVDDTFLKLREAAQKSQAARVQELASKIPQSYALHSFADYWQLKARGGDLGSGDVKAFIQKYEGTFIVDRLRNDWLLQTGRKGDWKAFDEHYPLFVLQDDAQVDCYALASRADKGQPVRDEARSLFARAANSLHTAGCGALAELLFEKGQFKEADVWERVRTLTEMNRSRAAIEAAGILSENAAKAVALAIEKPNQAILRSASQLDKQAAAIAWVMLARTNKVPGDYDSALKKLGKPFNEYVGVQLASFCAQRLEQKCAAYLPQPLPESLLGLGGDNSLEWMLRGLLRGQQWVLYSALYERLPLHLQQDAAWRYWAGHSAAKLGKQNVAQALWQNIAHRWDFYGLMARESLGQTLTIPPANTQWQEADVLAALKRPEIIRMQKFYDLGLRFEGNREWNWLLRGATDAKLGAIAEAGRRLGHLDRMVNTSERTKQSFDFAQRFPQPFYSQLSPIAKDLGLDTNWVYGLIRQESRFIVQVSSHVGAQGLMQLMPKTAAWVAKKINHPYSPSQIAEPQTNLLIGQTYLKMVLDDLDGLPILATAAYNAGPGRPRSWRSSLETAVEGAVFAETIPFNETRGYVKNVLANAVIYSAITGSGSTSLKARLGVVAPKSAGTTELP